MANILVRLHTTQILKIYMTENDGKNNKVVCLKHLCAQHRALRKLFKHAFICQRPQLKSHDDPQRDDQVTDVTDRQTDRQMSFQLYIVDITTVSHARY